MELHENIYNVNGSENFERYEDQPIVPDMVTPITIYQNDLMKMSEDRRESNYSLQSDISIGTTTGSDNSLPHLKYFRTPSVVVSDHSEDTGCVTYEDIRRIHNAFNRKRRTKTGRRHSMDANDQLEYGKRTESMVSGSTTDHDVADIYKSTENVSPVPRRKSVGYREGRKSLSFDDCGGEYELGVSFDRKALSECSSSNELSPIMSQCGSSNFSEDSSRSSMFSEISPVFLKKNMSFNEIQKRPANNAEANAKIEKENPELGYYSQAREIPIFDDGDFFMLERQRSLSYDDLCVDSSVTSDVSYTDLSTDLSACSSLSNLVGTVYYNTYDPNQDYGLHFSRKSNKTKNDKIKTSKSCSDFLSVSRIVEDYPHLRHRRQSNDQVAIDISQCRSKKNSSKEENRKKWSGARNSPTRCAKINKIICASDKLGARMKHALGRLIALRLKSFHESLNFQKENYLVTNRRSRSNESVFVDEKKKPCFADDFSLVESKIKGRHSDDSQEKSSDLEKKSNVIIPGKNDGKVPEVKKEWLSVQWNGDFGGETKNGSKDLLSRKISDCSTCSTNSEEHQSSNAVDAKTKTSGWRKLRNIVQWTPFFQTYKKQRYPWVQLAGHQGNFKAGPEQGTILKKLCPKEEKCYKILMKDALRPYVPEYKGQVTCDESDCIYLQLQDLLVDFNSPCVLDCKLGVRTYLEEELQKAKEKPKLRKDMYEKMIQVDPTAPTIEEHRLKAVTKPRYMIWRETISSSSTLGFRLEGVRKSDGKSSKDFKTTRTKEEVKKAFRDFVNGFPHAVPKYVQRLKAIKATLEVSIFFSSHEVIGSSLLFVHDQVKANVWLIDFAKTLMLPEQTFIDHKSQWVVGNHEDGYLTGIINLIEIFSELEEEQNSEAENPEETITGPTATATTTVKSTSESSAAINSTDET